MRGSEKEGNERVLATTDSFRTKVECRSDKGTRKTVDQLARDSEIAEFDEAGLRDENIRWFDVWKFGGD